MKPKQTSWIGKPHDFFKTNPKNIPVNMFKDNDKDGVYNVFDCQPNNPNKQGLIDALVGFAKGVGKGKAKQGWSEGMATPSVAEKFRRGREFRRAVRGDIKPVYQSPIERRLLKQGVARGTVARAVMLSEDMARAQDRRKEAKRQRLAENVEAYAHNPEYQLKGERMYGKVKARVTRAENYVANKARALQLAVARANPEFARNIRKSYQLDYLKRNLSPGARMRAEVQLAKMNNVTAGRRQKFRERTAESVFPIPSMTSYGSGAKTIQGIPGRGRGRPRGSLKKEYAAYGGVYGYRRYVSEQKRLFREQFKMKAQIEKQQRMPQYEQVQQVQQQTQLPPELQNQGVTPDYSQYQQVQEPQQYQYPQQQAPQEAPQQAIATVFKSSGGSPYPPVSRQPLAQPRQTIPYGYVESVDSFTGRRFLKKLPPTERWSGGG